GWSMVAFANDWGNVTRQQNGTSFFYFATEQFRYESEINKENTTWNGKYNNMHPADVNALSARLGWLPSFPQFSQNSIDIVKESREQGAKDEQEVIDDVVSKIKDGKIDWAIENPNDQRNFPRVFFNWRSNLLGDSGKGHEYFAKHLIGADNQVMTDAKNSWQPETVNVSDVPPEGKTDLLVSIDFRMTSSGLFSDIVFLQLPGMRSSTSAVQICIHLFILLMPLLHHHGKQRVIGMHSAKLLKYSLNWRKNICLLQKNCSCAHWRLIHPMKLPKFTEKFKTGEQAKWKPSQEKRCRI